MTAGLRLYNTLTRTKEAFRPIDPSNVRMYVCGPTVYDDAHIGNARPIIVFDLLFRLLRHLYGPAHVTYVRNVTDVDDKINARAAERGISIRELTDGTLKRFHEDIRALGVLMPEDVNKAGQPPRFIEPRATEHIEEMKALIKRLVAGGHAYVAEEHVLFHVPSMPDYGSLSKRPLDELEAGARVDVAPYKRSPLDFVLWKPSKTGDPAWASPTGIATPGRPGWHIECSAMSWRHLGEVFDIHAGGIDLVFPHHENEVAQTRCCFGTPAMAKYWLHNGFLQVEGEKMAKSAGNFVTIRELLTTDTFGDRPWLGEVLRLAMLRTHYRQPIDWTARGLTEAADELTGWALAAEDSEEEVLAARKRGERPVPDESVVQALSDDLNTPEALAALRVIADRAQQDRRISRSLLETAEFLGLMRPAKLRAYLQGVSGVDLEPAQIMDLERAATHYRAGVANGQPTQVGDAITQMEEKGVQVTFDTSTGRLHLRGGSKTGVATLDNLIERRMAARAAKNWEESDRIRDELAAMGIALKDNKDGTTSWEVAR